MGRYKKRHPQSNKHVTSWHGMQINRLMNEHLSDYRKITGDQNQGVFLFFWTNQNPAIVINDDVVDDVVDDDDEDYDADNAAAADDDDDDDDDDEDEDDDDTHDGDDDYVHI